MVLRHAEEIIVLAPPKDHEGNMRNHSFAQAHLADGLCRAKILADKWCSRLLPVEYGRSQQIRNDGFCIHQPSFPVAVAWQLRCRRLCAWLGCVDLGRIIWRARLVPAKDPAAIAHVDAGSAAAECRVGD